MAIGIVSDSDFDLEITKGTPTPELRPAQIIDSPRPGRSEGDNNVPDSIRQIIVDESVQNGRASALSFAQMVGVSPSSVSAYSNGATSTASYNNPNKKLSERLKKAKLVVAHKARKTLTSALDNITDDKLSEAKLTDLALVAKSMSGIIKDMEPAERPEAGNVNINGPSIVMYNPGFAKESSFDTVEVNE